MAEKLGLGPGVRELKLGPTFTSSKPSKAFHTLRYDFKPASVDVSKMATVDVGTNNTMTVTVPHLDGAGVPQTVFKGSQKPYNKECVLIVDRQTGEITLERLSSNIQVKKTRLEMKTQQLLAVPSTMTTTNRPCSPETHKSPTDGRSKNRTKVTSGKKKEPSHQLPPKRSSNYSKSNPAKPPQSSQKSNENCSSGSLPMIGLEHDDFALPPSITPDTTSHTKPASSPAKSTAKTSKICKGGNLSESSSSSSDNSSSSDSESEPEQDSKPLPSGDGKSSSTHLPSVTAENFLKEDLQLSESESDSD